MSLSVHDETLCHAWEFTRFCFQHMSGIRMLLGNSHMLTWDFTCVMFAYAS
jgi:hypothetical protein